MTKSQIRLDAEKALEKFLSIIWELNTPKNRLLYVGNAGDKNGCEYRDLFRKLEVKTLDINAGYHPDYVMDITKTSFPDGYWDIIVMIQTIEHIQDISNLSRELFRILSPYGFLIIDCPLNCPKHSEKDFGDYRRLSCEQLIDIHKDYFDTNTFIQTELNSSVLFSKRNFILPVSEKESDNINLQVSSYPIFSVQAILLSMYSIVSEELKLKIREGIALINRMTKKLDEYKYDKDLIYFPVSKEERESVDMSTINPKLTACEAIRYLYKTLNNQDIRNRLRDAVVIANRMSQQLLKYKTEKQIYEELWTDSKK